MRPAADPHPRRPEAALPPGEDLEVGEAASINLPWLVKLRWAAVAGQLGTILVVHLGLGVPLPLAPLLGVLALEVAINLGLQRWTRAVEARSWTPELARRAEHAQGVVMGVDTLLLSVLLYFTGGVANPFAAFFFVHIVLAAVLLAPIYAYIGTGVAFACLWALFFWHRPLPAVEEDATLHLAGLVVALGTTAAITVFFVARVTSALHRRSQELARQRELQARAERLEALGTLAAGAAHELASPLSTIAVVAKELERDLVRAGADEDAVEDVRLVREEVARCRRILDRMTLESGESAGESLASFTVRELVEETLTELFGRERVETELGDDARDAAVYAPRAALCMALRSVLANALDASEGGASVRLSVERRGDELEFVVVDRGEGMDAERLRRALDPFFTTKEPGRGMGLGLFLARSVVERLGGTLRLDSEPGRGTRARLRLPLSRLRRPAGRGAAENARPGDEKTRTPD